MIAAEFETAQLDRRRAPRAPVSFDAKLGRGGLDRALCKVVDLSTGGCRLHAYSEMKRGSTIWLTLPGTPPVAADVMWSSDFMAGCQFHKPLDEAELERLLAL